MRKYLPKVVLSLLIVVLTGAVTYGVLSSRSGNQPQTRQQAPTSQSPSKPAELSYVDKKLQSMTLRQKVASLLILHTPGVDVDTLKTYLKTYQPGGLIFMLDNIPQTLNDLTALTARLQSDPNLPYLFAMDEEGGVVKRLISDNYPAANQLGFLPVKSTETAFHDRSVLLNQAGINLNFGIVADVTSNPSSFIYSRSFGGDQAAVSERVAAAVKGSKALTLSTLKHFPGHGETTSDSHTSIPTTPTSQTDWQQRDNPPFASGIQAGANFVMFGHLIYSAVDTRPATLSAKWHQILADLDDFKGTSITDDMIMLQQSGDANYANPVTNAVKAIQAGNTMLLYVLNNNGGAASIIDPNTIIDGLVQAVKAGTIKESQIDNDARQVLELRHNLPNLVTKQ